ncbi:CPP1-like family protein [Aphanothece sacrum]|uniref:Molecular chaperone DnaJ n=1 Tax=Aphanothece sacrum FPU1 TaxID=1920663 RepID=A0A401III6_APHSA|nr:CPP1-like family protein [Aphanothece sacrum]GBF81135.1 molecular chaperone DnaJ [Aphanothece sacrum FPU1]GBF86209.1 molecular chaperone DnaJ [Aphanothece sacrum FPU3]
MNEQTPYEKLGVTEASSFEEIQEAKNRLTQQYRDDSKVVEGIETAYDSIIMERLRMRQEGRIKVPERIRFPERNVQVSANPPTISPNNSPQWLQRFIDTPSSKDILISGGVFAILSGIAGFSSIGQPSLAPLLLSLGFFANIYFLNRKEQRFGRAFLMTLVGLFIGVGLGIGLAQLLQISNLAGGTTQLPVSLTIFFVFWVISSFLR